eukprot:8878739-Alexandrium_andersonii.AAC.1
MDVIKKAQQDMAPRKTQLNTLISFCNVAVADMLNAQSAWAAAQAARAKQAQDKAKKTEESRAKAARKLPP